jgi:predicted ATPase
MHLTRVIIRHCRFPAQQAYPFDLPVLQHTRTIEFHSPVTFFTGENGTGKSTLLEAICRRCRIHIWEGIERTRPHANRYEKMLSDALDVEWTDGPVPGSFFSPELFRNFSQLVDEWAVSSPGLFDYFGGRSLVAQSHGQACMSFFRSIYKVKGLHFLDEPEAALSPQTQLQLLDLLTRLSRAGHAQFIISTHSPILMACPQAFLYTFDGDAIQPTAYTQTRHYQVYKAFFDARGSDAGGG